MVAEGEATVEQIDLSITDGPGLRWPVQGPMLTFHLAGGQGGMAHMLDHFGPSLLSPWTRLVAADLTPELRDAVVDGCDREADGRTIDQLVAERDAGVIAVLRALGSRMTPRAGRLDRTGPGRVDRLQRPPLRALLRPRVRPRHRRRDGSRRPRARVPRPCECLVVHRRGARALPRPGAGRRRPRGAVVGDRGVRKLLRIWHELRVDGTLRATEEVLGVHVDTAVGRSSPFPADIARRIDAALVEPPEEAGAAIRLGQSH